MTTSHEETYETTPEDEEFKSKTQVKKEMTALQDLGQKLTTLPSRILSKCELPDDLLNAIAEYKRIPDKRGARKRQLQFIGRLMRDIDPAPIIATLYEEGQQAELAKRRFHRLEDTRERLINGDQALLEALISNHPGIDIQYLRQLIRQAAREKATGKSPASARKLFAFLKDIPDI